MLTAEVAAEVGEQGKRSLRLAASPLTGHRAVEDAAEVLVDEPGLGGEAIETLAEFVRRSQQRAIGFGQIGKVHGAGLGRGSGIGHLLSWLFPARASVLTPFSISPGQFSIGTSTTNPPCREESGCPTRMARPDCPS